MSSRIGETRILILQRSLTIARLFNAEIAEAIFESICRLVRFIRLKHEGKCLMHKGWAVFPGGA